MVTLEQYLNTSYEGAEREYIDGRVVERNTGLRDHSEALRNLIGFFGSRERAFHTYGFPIQRVQVNPTRVRVPDVCVYVGAPPEEQVFRTPPFLAIEVLAQRDRASDLQEKLDDYFNFGVRFVWLVDPRTKRGYTFDINGGREIGLRTRNPDLEFPVDQAFD